MADPIAANSPSFDLAYVISDLHLGGDTGLQIFESADQFKELVKHILDDSQSLRAKKKSARTLLVINGDFVDFLAEPEATLFKLTKSDVTLRQILNRPEFGPVLKGLQDLVAADGIHLVITLGNHDVELALPDTRRALVELLTKNNVALEGKLELAFDGWGYRFQVGGRRALCLHGNESDGFNFTRYDELDRIVHDLQLFGRSEFGTSWNPSAGSWFVINALNPIKRQFPFVDLLKPELPLAATVVGVLDPKKVVYIKEAARLKAGAMKNESERPASQRRMLAADPLSATSSNLLAASRYSPSEDEIEEQAELALANKTIDELIRMPTTGEMLGMADWLVPLREAIDSMRDKAAELMTSAAAAVTGSAREVHWRALRSAVSPLVSDDPYDVGAMDKTDNSIDAGVRTGYDVVFAGHTHFRRIAKRPSEQGLYVNTGTWAGLITLTRSQVNGPDFEKIYDALRAPDRNELHKLQLIRQECTVARMSIQSAGKVAVTLGGVEKDTMTVNFPKDLTRVCGQ